MSLPLLLFLSGLLSLLRWLWHEYNVDNIPNLHGIKNRVIIWSVDINDTNILLMRDVFLSPQKLLHCY